MTAMARRCRAPGLQRLMGVLTAERQRLRLDNQASHEEDAPARPESCPEPQATRGFKRGEPVLGRKSFPIVGIGASAGGLEAFSRLLKRLPLGHRDGLCAGAASGPGA